MGALHPCASTGPRIRLGYRFRNSLVGRHAILDWPALSCHSKDWHCESHDKTKEYLGGASGGDGGRDSTTIPGAQCPCRLGKPLNMDKTLAENGMEDETEEFLRLSIDLDHHIPVIHLHFNDDLTEA
mmetsp:Transcript_11350/g.23642  ORF Transcript_11350/g.23642 Transcript_11350/m.23642 type:complete len:127 (-) Transcript_11350:57-437(-)